MYTCINTYMCIHLCTYTHLLTCEFCSATSGKCRVGCLAATKHRAGAPRQVYAAQAQAAEMIAYV